MGPTESQGKRVKCRRRNCDHRNKGWMMYFEKGGRDHEPRNEGGLQQATKGKGQILPYTFREETALPSPYMRTSDFRTTSLVIC